MAYTRFDYSSVFDSLTKYFSMWCFVDHSMLGNMKLIKEGE